MLTLGGFLQSGFAQAEAVGYIRLVLVGEREEDREDCAGVKKKVSGYGWA